MKLRKNGNGIYELNEDKEFDKINKRFELFMKEIIVILKQLQNKVQEMDVKVHRKISPEIKKIIIALGDIQNEVKKIK